MPGPDAARRPVQDIVVVDRIIGQRERVAAVGGRPDGLAEDDQVANHPGREDERRSSAPAGRRASSRCPAIARLDDECGQDRQRGSREHARPAQSAPDRSRGRPGPARAIPAVPARPGPPRERRPSGVSVITERLCQTRTGSHAVTRAASIDRAGERPEPLAAAAVNQTVPAPRPRCNSAMPQANACHPESQIEGASKSG